MTNRDDMTTWPRAIVFDLDGTLVDSAPDIQHALNIAFAPLGVAPLDLDAVKGLIGGGAPAAVSRAAGLSHLNLGPDDMGAVLDRFYEAYAEASAVGSGLYPGAHEVLAELAGQGRRLALCTNKAEHITRIALAALGIDRYFGAVVGATDAMPKKPDAAMVQAALAGLGCAAVEAVMIGDTSADIGAAKAAGCRSIAISHGYSRVPSHDLGADAVIADLPGVIPAIGGLRIAIV